LAAGIEPELHGPRLTPWKRIDEYLWWQVAEYTYDTVTIRSRARSG
jgi:hypothetical protein